MIFVNALGNRVTIGHHGWHCEGVAPCQQLSHNELSCFGECLGDDNHCGELAFEVGDAINNFGDTE